MRGGWRKLYTLKGCVISPVNKPVSRYWAGHTIYIYIQGNEKSMRQFGLELAESTWDN